MPAQDIALVAFGAHAYITGGEAFAFIGLVLLGALVVVFGLAFSWHFYSGLFDLAKNAPKRLRSRRDVHRGQCLTTQERPLMPRSVRPRPSAHAAERSCR